MRKIIIASDHAGFALKEKLKKTLDIDSLDLGCYENLSCDYPDYAKKLTEKVLETGHFGVLICNTGIGMCIAANRVKGIRAALCYELQTVSLTREHNNANVLCLGSAFVSLSFAQKMIQKFMETEFLGGRHRRRVEKIDENNKNC